MEGKDYVMADGDVVEFRFNVRFDAFAQVRVGVTPLSPHRVRKESSVTGSIRRFGGPLRTPCAASDPPVR